MAILKPEQPRTYKAPLKERAVPRKLNASTQLAKEEKNAQYLTRLLQESNEKLDRLKRQVEQAKQKTTITARVLKTTKDRVSEYAAKRGIPQYQAVGDLLHEALVVAEAQESSNAVRATSRSGKVAF